MESESVSGMVCHQENLLSVGLCCSFGNWIFEFDLHSTEHTKLSLSDPTSQPENQ